MDGQLSPKGSRGPAIQFHDYHEGGLEAALAIRTPHFVQRDVALRQLRYIENYAGQIGCKCFAIEDGYVDRDFMEDFSVFYAKCFIPYSNHCRRIHFFSCDRSKIISGIDQLIGDVGIGARSYTHACKTLSDAAYLGFCVVKPLDGSPMGRTVLKPYPEVPENSSANFERRFRCTRHYKTHFMGIEFSVRGLGFQQQDIGVSACATTAVWSALQKVRDHQHIATFTPAQITNFASKNSLPFGRSMPSEGLSLDQMCQAVQAMGVSPNVYRISSVLDAKAYLYTSVMSEFPPILILGREKPDSHAVVVSGVKVIANRVVKLKDGYKDERFEDLLGLYIHDDRRGPYLRASIQEKGGGAQIHCGYFENNKQETDILDLKHIIIPTPSKIRLSFGNLREMAGDLCRRLDSLNSLFRKKGGIEIPRVITVESRIVKSHKYTEELVAESAEHPAGLVGRICYSIPMSRHVGVISVATDYTDPIDLLIDTTGTLRNTHCLGVVARTSHLPATHHRATRE